MKTPQIAAGAFLVLTLAAGCSSSAGTAPSTSSTGASSQSASTPPENRERPVNAVVDIGPMLTGTFQGSTPGNNLTAITTGTLSPTNGSIFNLTMRVTGTYMDSGVREQGVIHLENQGRTVSLQYIPHFDPAVGMITSDALQFTPRELESACNFDVKPRGDGYVGETVGTTTCARAIRGAVGKWSFEVEPGSIRIRSSDTGETLRFKRVSS
jgi:hypothetical protein